MRYSVVDAKTFIIEKHVLSSVGIQALFHSLKSSLVVTVCDDRNRTIFVISGFNFI